MGHVRGPAVLTTDGLTKEAALGRRDPTGLLCRLALEQVHAE